jgi:IS1 family transposase
MNKLPMSKRAAVIAALVEGNSLRATCRMTGVAMNTVLKLLAEIGGAAVAFHDETVRNVAARRIQIDEIWQYVYAKAKNVPEDKKGTFGYGDVWTWTAIDADTKLIISYLVGPRTPDVAFDLIDDLAARVQTELMPQITTDGLSMYPRAIEKSFGMDVHFAQLQKHYGLSGETQGTARYSPPKLTSITKAVIRGNPDEKHISTSFVERQNLTMRMSMRRFTRLTNGFSKKLTNHAAAVALHFLHYNFCRVHKTLRVTPAMEAGLATRVMSLEEVIGLLDRYADAA